MIFKRVYSALSDISAKLDILLEANVIRAPASEACVPEQGKPVAFRLDDAKMQEGIANLLGYDPLSKKRSDE